MRVVRALLRPGALLWAGGTVAAGIMVLGVNGSLASWAQAIITNDTNTVATGQAVILREVSGSTCFSSASATNSSTCSTINEYGGTGVPIMPNDSRNIDVVFTNAGGANASTFALTPGSCSQSPTAGSGSPAAANLCTSGDLRVAVSCSPGGTYNAGSAWSDLTYAAAAPSTTPKTHTASSGDLNAGASWTCRFTVSMISTATPTAQGITVSQPLTWTLTQ